MDNYKVIELLGKGPQGEVNLVENRKEGSRYVMKKVECKDESEANRAYEESLLLHDLKHPCVSGYRKFFIEWEKKDCGMNACIIMDYFKHGTLKDIITEQRKKGQMLAELKIKKWLGQIVEALVFLHKKNIIHRNLKPSNVFLLEDSSLSLGDPGVPTIMYDVRYRTRKLPGAITWMPPEVENDEYDQRSDIWSVGCILLELATCGILDEETMVSKLMALKKSDTPLTDLLAKLSKEYSTEMISLIQGMLRRNCHERPTSEQLLSVPYLCDCLALSGTVVTERNRRRSAVPPIGRLRTNSGAAPVMDYLRQNMGNTICVIDALNYIAKLTSQQGSSLEQNSKISVVRAMLDYVSELKVQLAGCEIFNNILPTAQSNDVLYSSEIINAIPKAMKAHVSSGELQQVAASFLMGLSAVEEASELIGEEGGLSAILSAMRVFPNNENLCTTCCNALWSLTINENNSRIMTEEKALPVIVRTIRTHFSSQALVEAGCALLLSLSLADNNLGEMTSLECAGLLVDAIKAYVKVPKVVKNGCMALSSLVETDEESAFCVLMKKDENGKEVAGIPIIVAAYEEHKDNVEVVRGVASLIVELCEYDEILAEMIYLKTNEIVLYEMLKRFNDNAEVTVMVKAALNKMAEKKKKC